MPDPKAPADGMVVIGRLGTPYGVRGWLHFKSFTEPPENALSYDSWHVAGVRGAPSWAPVELAQIKPHKQAFICRLEGCSDRTAAERWVRREIAVPETMLPDPGDDEVYWRQLIGCRVVFDSGPQGEVVSMLETGAHDVMVVSVDGVEHLIPFVEPYLVDLDVAARVVNVSWNEAWH